MIITKLKSVRNERDILNESSDSGIDSKFPSFNSTDTLKNNFTKVNSKKLNAKQQAKELARIKKQIVMLIRLFENQLFAISIALKKAFIDIKIYDKNSQLYYDHDYFKYDNYVYEMEKIFKSNKDLKNVRDSEEHKIVFFTLWLIDNTFQMWRTKKRVASAKKYIWKNVKKILLKHVSRIKFLNNNNYVK